jgi:DNA-binding NarL/FixJ family response regulator
VVDDHSLVREGLAKLIDQEPDMCVCAEAADAIRAYDGVVESGPDAVIVDLSLRGDSGLDLIKRLQAWRTRRRSSSSRCTTRPSTPSARSGRAPSAT